MVESAVEDCHKNCDLNNLSHGPDEKCYFIAGKCEEVMPRVTQKVEGSKIVAIVDPP